MLLATPVAAMAVTSGAPQGSSAYGARDHFSHFSGTGYQTHRGRSGALDVNACSSDVARGTLSCDARVLIKPAATTAAASGPTATATSACPTGDVNAPAAVIAGGNGGYDPCYLQSAYNVAASAEAQGGSGQIVAIVDYSVDPTIASDLATYRAQFGLPACPTGTVSASNTGCVFQQVAQSGAPSSGSSGWDVEISLDVDTVSAICPKCQILLLEASSATNSSLGSAVNTAVSDGAIAVSNSYGGSESSGENSTATSYYQHPGVAIVASSGDAAGVVEFPAVAPDVVAVGGTSLLQYANQGTRSANATESVWNGTPAAGDGAGAGCSLYESAASWQSSFLSAAGGTSVCAKRVTADVSADADPDTGLWIYDSYSQGGWLIVGGTSLASPLVAAIYGLAGNAKGSSVYPTSLLYADSSAFYHVTSGKVGTCGNYLCDATKSIDGYNGPSGVGTPGGTGALSAFAFNPAVAPAAPATPTVGATTATTSALSWGAVSGASSYNVYSGTSASSLSLLVSGLSSPTYTVTGLTPSTNYFFAVTATNATGTSPQSGVASATTSAPGAPSAPTSLVATAGNASVNLSWTAPSSNGGSPITGYVVYYSSSSGSELTGSSYSTSATTATISSLNNATTYYFEVVATNGYGDSVVSNEASATPAGVASAPTLTAATPGAGNVTLRWTAPGSNGGSALTGYVVYDGTTASPTTKVTSVSSSTTSVTVSSLTAGTTYYFEVVATNAAGSSPASNVLSAVPTVAAPGTPGSLSARASGTTVNLSWRASTGSGPITYTVKRSTSSSMSNAVSSSAGTSTTFAATGLSTSTRYYFEVIATNSGGSSAPAGPVSSRG